MMDDCDCLAVGCLFQQAPLQSVTGIEFLCVSGTHELFSAVQCLDYEGK